MLTLDDGRNAAIRDLDALSARLESLRPREWSRQTPCNDWTVRDLGEHLAWSTHAISAKISELVSRRSGEPSDRFDDSAPASIDSTHEIVIRIIHGRNLLFHSLGKLQEDDLDTVLKPSSSLGGYSMTGLRRLSMCVLEFGLHRFDIEDALGVQFAGVDVETVHATEELFGNWLAAMAERSGSTPDEPWSLHLDGDVINHTLTWDGAAWSSGPDRHIPATRLRGDDSALALFICGRIEADDRRLACTGSLDVVRQFKTYVPGP